MFSFVKELLQNAAHSAFQGKDANDTEVEAEISDLVLHSSGIVAILTGVFKKLSVYGNDW